MTQNAPERDTLVVALDYTGCAHEVVEEATRLGKKLEAHLVLLCVCHLPEGVDPDTVLHGGAMEGQSTADVLAADAKRELEALAAIPRHAGVSVSVEIRMGDVVTGILKSAEERNATMLVTGTHGRTGLKRWVLGSVAEQVVRQASCPVLTVRSKMLGAHPGRTDAMRAVGAEADG